MSIAVVPSPMAKKSRLTAPHMRWRRDFRHKEKLWRRLVRAGVKSEVGTRESRLWAAAYNNVKDPLKSLFEEVENNYPAQVRTNIHWGYWVDRLEDATDLFAHKVTWPHLPSKKDRHRRLEKFSRLNGWTVDEGHAVFEVEGSAIRDALFTLKIQVPRVFETFGHEPTPQRIVLVGICFVCWKTGFPSPQNKFFCPEHARFRDSYKRASERRVWRSSDQPLERRESFVWHWMKGIKEKFPYALEPTPDDFSPLVMLGYGNLDGINHVDDWPIDLQQHWWRFPRIRQFMVRKKLGARRYLMDPKAILAALDPVGKVHAEIHQLMHEVLAADPRLLFDRLAMAEAYLEADVRRRSNRGPGAWKPDAGEMVVPYYFTSYPDCYDIYPNKNIAVADLV